MEAESDVFKSIRCSTNHTTKYISRVQMTIYNSFPKSILKIIRNFLVNLVNDFPCGKKTSQMIKVAGPFSSRQKSYSLNLSSFWFKYFSFSHYSIIEGILQSMYVWSQRIFILLLIFWSFNFCQPFWFWKSVVVLNQNPIRMKYWACNCLLDIIWLRNKGHKHGISYV